MRVEITTAPPNSIILISDSPIGEIPQSFDDPSVSATESCIALGTLAAVDGETCILLMNTAPCDHDTEGMQRRFSEILQTPNGAVHVFTCEMKSLGKVEVAGVRCKIDIWTDRLIEPSKICVVLSDKL